MRGITEESLMHVMKMHDMNDGKTSLIFSHLFNECTDLNAWQPIETAPKDREILVYAPPYQELRCLKQVIAHHDSAGYCIDELRYPTHWQELPKDPK